MMLPAANVRALFAILVCMMCGCGCGGGPTLLPVTGTVSYNGAPVEKGEISFVPTDGGAPDAGIIENGKYSLRAKPGKKRVEIRGSRALPANRQVNPEMGLVYEDYIPAAFNRESTLMTEVGDSGNRVINFDLPAQ